MPLLNIFAQVVFLLNIIFHVAYYYIVMLNLCIEFACLMVEEFPFISRNRSTEKVNNIT